MAHLVVGDVMNVLREIGIDSSQRTGIDSIAGSSRAPVYPMHDEEVGLIEGKESGFYLFVSARLAFLCAAHFFPCASSLDWMACALTIARITPGKPTTRPGRHWPSKTAFRWRALTFSV